MMKLGSYAKGPNNMICREWDGKAGPWTLGNGFVRIFMGAHTKVDWACIVKPHTDVV